MPQTLASDARTRLTTLAGQCVLVQVDPEMPTALYYATSPSRGVPQTHLDDSLAIALPQSERAKTFTIFHASPFGGHFGLKRTFYRLSCRYWWPKMYQDLAEWIAGCETCNRFKKHRELTAPLGLLPHPPSPWHTIAFDFTGPLVCSSDFKYVLVIVDLFTRYAITVPTRNMLGETVARALYRYIFCVHGFPQRILSDNATNFSKGVTRDLVQLMGMKQIFSSAYYPKGNGLVERTIQSLKSAISVYSGENESSWFKYLDTATFAYNTGPHAALGFSPFRALFGREPRIPGESEVNTSALSGEADAQIKPYALELAHTLQKLHQEIRLRQTEQLEGVLDTNAVTAFRHPFKVFEPNDVVNLRMETTTGGPKSKSERKQQARSYKLRYDGPFVVLRRASPRNYVVAALDPATEHSPLAGAEEHLVHVSRLLPVPRVPTDISHVDSTAIDRTPTAEPLIPLAPPRNLLSAPSPTFPGSICEAAVAPSDSAESREREAKEPEAKAAEVLERERVATAVAAPAPSSPPRGRQKFVKDQPKVWVVEKVLGRRLVRGRLEYLIQWDGFPSSENSWEPARNVDAPDAIRAYEISYEKSSPSTPPSSNPAIATPTPPVPSMAMAPSTTITPPAPTPAVPPPAASTSLPRRLRDRPRLNYNIESALRDHVDYSALACSLPNRPAHPPLRGRLPRHHFLSQIIPHSPSTPHSIPSLRVFTLRTLLNA